MCGALITSGFLIDLKKMTIKTAEHTNFYTKGEGRPVSNKARSIQIIESRADVTSVIRLHLKFIVEGKGSTGRALSRAGPGRDVVTHKIV